MKKCTVDELLKQSFNPVFINVLKQHWHTTKCFGCIGAPKKQNLLLFLQDCSITYTDACGHTLTAHGGDVVYTAVGSEYKAQLFDFKDTEAHTVGINFLLYDETGEEIVLTDGIKVFSPTQGRTLSLLFQKALMDERTDSFTQSRIVLMEILCALAPQGERRAIPVSITKAIDYLAEHIEQNPTVAQLADLCHISEVYFRKQFKAATGSSPTKYRNAMRLERARAYLAYGEISIQEISDALGYPTASHFIGEFKRKYGLPPLKYRKLSKNG